MNTFGVIFRLTILLSAFVCEVHANAAEFSIGPNGFGISIEGEIKSGDFRRFNTFIGDKLLSHTKVDYDTVFLNSPGGSVEDALQFADMFSKHLSSVSVMRGNRCFSACTMIWAGGAERYLEGDAKLGFHRLSFTKNDVDVRKTKAKIDPANQKVTEFFREVGLPDLLIDKMNETPPSDIYIIDNRWLIEHELDRAVTYQPAFLDVVEKQCGVDPSQVAYKQARHQTPDENEALKTWMICADGIKTANRNIALNDWVQGNKDQAKENARLKSIIAHTKWSLVVETDKESIYIDKNTEKWNGRVVKLWLIFNSKLNDNNYFSALDNFTIDCNTGTMVTNGYSTFCDGKMCEAPKSTSPNENTVPQKPKSKIHIRALNAVCKKM